MEEILFFVTRAILFTCSIIIIYYVNSVPESESSDHSGIWWMVGIIILYGQSQSGKSLRGNFTKHDWTMKTLKKNRVLIAEITGIFSAIKQRDFLIRAGSESKQTKAGGKLSFFEGIKAVEHEASGSIINLNLNN